jgi:hypothetical protein
MATSWQDLLREQQEELKRLEQMNEALDAGQGTLDADITRALKPRSASASATSAAGLSRTSANSASTTPRVSSRSSNRVTSRGSTSNGVGSGDYTYNGGENSAAVGTGGTTSASIVYGMDDLNIDIPLNSRPSSDGVAPGLPPSPEIDGSKAPDVALRYT